MALKELKGKQRALIITDKPLFDMGYTDKVTSVLDEINVHHQVFYQVRTPRSLEVPTQCRAPRCCLLQLYFVQAGLQVHSVSSADLCLRCALLSPAGVTRSSPT